MASQLPTIFSFLAVMLILFPLPWQLRAKRKNIPTLGLTFWLVQQNLGQGINAFVWRDNVIIKYEVYCEIFAYLQLASTLALVCACLCTLRNLERVISPHMSLSTPDEIRRRNRFDFFMCFLVPIAYAALCLIVAANQYNLYEGVGPKVPIYFTWTAVLLFIMPPIYLSTFTVTYGTLVFKWLVLHRGQITKVLHESTDGMSLLQFIRLLTLSSILALYSIGFSVWQLIKIPSLVAWISWENVHSGFGKVDQFPTVIMPYGARLELWVGFSIYPSAAVWFFLLFGMNEEVLSDLVQAWNHVRTWVGTATGLGQAPSNDSVSMNDWAPRLPPKKLATNRWLAGDDLDFNFDEEEDITGDAGHRKPASRFSRSSNGSQNSFALTSYGPCGTLHATQ